MSEELSRIQQTKVQTKFLLGLAAILTFFTGLASITVYFYAKKSLERSAYEKTELVMSAMAANRSYVREILRPKMYETFEDDTFIIEAMSSSFISRQVMERLNQDLSDFSYRRVAINARNPKYEANDLEASMINKFQDNPELDEWHGIIEEEGRRYYMRFKPEYFDKSCTYCHGDPVDAPQKIVEMYGENRGFYRQPGDVSGVISVGLPVDINLNQIKEMAIVAFMAGIPLILFLYVIISVFFNRFIVQNLHNLLDIFRNTLRDESEVETLLPPHEMDEISELNDAAKTLAGQLKESRSQLESYTDRLLQSKELLQSVFDGITDPVVLLDCDAKIKIVNKEFEKRYEVTLDNVIGLSPLELEIRETCPLKSCGELFKHFPTEPVTKEVKLSRGSIYLIYFYPIASTGGNIENLVCYVKDITEQKELEAKIQQTEKLVSIGQLAAGIAHEINNPLGVILCHIDLLRGETLSHEAKNDLSIIEKHVDNCRTIISDLLKFAHRQKTIKESGSINSLIEEVCTMISPQLQKKDIDLQLKLDPSMIHFNMDLDKIKQVVLNMLINSSQAIESAGSITIGSEYEKEIEQCRITIEDSGPGIPENKLDKIFDPFFTTKSPGEGTGLGLSVSYGIIKDHNGEISVESELGRTTKFIITLPVAEVTDE